MAKTPSNSVALGSPAPDFHLADAADGRRYHYRDIAGSQGTLIMFICNHCPFVIHILDELLRIGEEYKRQDIGMAAINSNDVQAYPDDAPEKMAQLSRSKNFPFVYLFDETQQVAKAYDAACTPDFFLYDGAGRLVYHGQFDDSRPGNGLPVTGHSLRAAMDALLARETIDSNQAPSIGCNIKWRR